MTVQFVIHGKPFAKQRHRMTRRGTAYTPKETISFERTVGQIAMQHFKKPLDGPVFVEINAVFQVPKSWSKRKKSSHIGQPHTQRPDLDNLMKAILDGLNRIAFADDRQVTSMILQKWWGHLGETQVKIGSLLDQSTIFHSSTTIDGRGYLA